MSSINQQLDAALIELQRALEDADFPRRFVTPDGGEVEVSYARIIRLHHAVLRIDASDNHLRPHFHIDYKREYSASYALDNFERMAGSIPRRYEEALVKWAMENRKILYDKWQELHPTKAVFALQRESSLA